MTLPNLRRRTPLRLVAASFAVVAAAGLAVVGAAPALAATSATVHTDNGLSVSVRSGPHTSSSATGSKSDGDTVSISCQTHGDSVTGKYGTSDVWDKIDGGYITDTYVYTGSDGTVAPACSDDGGGGTACSTSGLGDPNTCSEAVSWANSHIHTSNESGYYNLCDHLVGLAYGFPASGSESAYVHWTQIPGSYKHSGTSVPAGGLAFFSTGSGNGHVMISIGGGEFVSNDIHGHGTYTKTTISEIESTWGANYLGWAQPWFKYNH